MEVLPHFGPENQTRKIHKVFELYQIFMYNFLCQTVLILSIYTLFIKRIDTFCSGGIETVGTQKLTKAISSLCVSKCLNTLILYTADALIALLRKNWFFFFFFVF